MALPKSRSWKTWHVWDTADLSPDSAPTSHPSLLANRGNPIAVHPYGAIATRWFSFGLPNNGLLIFTMWGWMNIDHRSGGGPGVELQGTIARPGGNNWTDAPLDDGQWGDDVLWREMDTYGVSAINYGTQRYESTDKQGLYITATFGFYYLSASITNIQGGQKVGAIWRGLTPDEWKLLKT